MSQDLPQDYHARWETLARHGLQYQHGQLCRLALMYALTLRRGAAAEEAEVRFVGPRVWEAEGSRKHRSERVALFEDDLVRDLLQMVEITSDFPKSSFPKVACGSSLVEVWCHSLASRKPYRGKTNFEAVCQHFHLHADALTPNSIYLAAAAVFRGLFAIDPSEVVCVLSAQLGLKTFQTALYVSQRYSFNAEGKIAHVRCQKGHLMCGEEKAETQTARGITHTPPLERNTGRHTRGQA